MKTALITGITGQDGSYLAELLLTKGYEVHGTVRRASFERLEKSYLPSHLSRINFHVGDISDPAFIYKTVFKTKPDEVYHLAAESFVSYSLSTEIELIDVNFKSTYYLLNSFYDINPNGRFFLAASSEMFGEPLESPQTEKTPFNPRSLYGIAKASSFYFLKDFRRKSNFFAVSGILYNHESPRRRDIFVTKKIVKGAVAIKMGKERKIRLGNLEARRDWGWAPEYVEAIWKMTTASIPQDYIIATGKTYSVREFLEITFQKLNLDYREFIEIDKELFRPSEKNVLCGNPARIRKNLGWYAKKDLNYIIEKMLEAELKNEKSN